jgi:hypothetical protein
MTQQTEHRAKEMALHTILAKPPPHEPEQWETELFQTMNELRLRHWNPPAAKDRLYLWGGGLLVGSLVFGAFYLMIQFLE